MRTNLTLAAAALSGAALLAACSGNGLTGMQSAVPGVQSQLRNSQFAPERTGVAPQYLQMLRFGQAPYVRPDTHPDVSKLADIAVSDWGSGAVEVLNPSYKLAETITDGLNGPDGDYYDAKGNLYVADYAGVNVTEYSKTGKLTHTYSVDLLDPVNVTVDKKNHVFVADYASGQPSVVVEYPQGRDNPIASCSTKLANEGVVVDSKGDVFVSGNNSNGTANIIEYKGGLKGCKATMLKVPLGYAGGLQLDAKQNLVVCDQTIGVDIVPPPYKSVGSTIKGGQDSFHVALDAANTTIFIADPSSDADVLVDKYPSGGRIATLGSKNGLTDPSGVATYSTLK